MQKSKKSLGRSLANSSRSRSSQKFGRRASCVHRRYTDSQTGRQTDTQTYGDLINFGSFFALGPLTFPNLNIAAIWVRDPWVSI